MAERAKLLFVDDEPGVLSALRRCAHDYELDAYFAGSPAEALNLLAQQRFSAVFSDQRMPLMLGTELLVQVAERQPEAQRFIISGYGDFDDITEAFNQGVIQRFIAKPWPDEELRELLASFERSGTGFQSQPDEGEIGWNFHGLWSQSPPMYRVFEQLSKAARANVPVFVLGETGTGKEKSAAAIHALSLRHSQPFVAFNCANFSDNLMESQLFGHRKGAFTGADRDNEGLFAAVGSGTLFLDELGSLPLALQGKLLRVLQERRYSRLGEFQEREFQGQVVSASNQSLASAVAEGSLREDLRYRLEVIPVVLPPLRQRPEDIVPLFQRFLGQDAYQLSQSLIQRLETYQWPGNVRELENCAHYAAAMAESELLDEAQLPAALRQAEPVDHKVAASVAAVAPSGVTGLTPEAVYEALHLCQGNRSAAARHLGVSRMTLWRYLKKHPLELSD